jgi:hypothetical protein
MYALAAILGLIIAMGTVGFQVYRTARTNPVDVLRYE